MIFLDKILQKKECAMPEPHKYKTSDMKSRESKIKMKDLMKKTKDLQLQ